MQTRGILWQSLRESFTRRAGLIAALFHLHNILHDEGVGPVTLNEEPPRFRRARGVVDSDGCFLEKYATHSAGVPCKAGETPRPETIRKAIAHLNIVRPHCNEP